MLAQPAEHRPDQLAVQPGAEYRGQRQHGGYAQAHPEIMPQQKSAESQAKAVVVSYMAPLFTGEKPRTVAFYFAALIVQVAPHCPRISTVEKPPASRASVFMRNGQGGIIMVKCIVLNALQRFQPGQLLAVQALFFLPGGEIVCEDEVPALFQ